VCGCVAETEANPTTKKRKPKATKKLAKAAAVGPHVHASTVTFKEISSEVVYCWNLSEAVQKYKSDNGVSVLVCA
jgi:hypothetical protein